MYVIMGYVLTGVHSGIDVVVSPFVSLPEGSPLKHSVPFRGQDLAEFVALASERLQSTTGNVKSEWSASKWLGIHE
jgi:hypothetical protein